MADTKIKRSSFDSDADFLAHIRTLDRLHPDLFETREDFVLAVRLKNSSSSILDKQGVLDLVNDWSTLDPLINDEEIEGFAYSPSLSNKTATPVVVEITDFHDKDDAEKVHESKKKTGFFYKRRAVWVTHPQLGIQNLLWINQVCKNKEGDSDLTVAVGESIRLPLHIVEKGTRLVHLANDGEFKFVSFTADVLHSGRGAMMNVKDATSEDKLVQAQTFAMQGKKAYSASLSIGIKV